MANTLWNEIQDEELRSATLHNAKYKAVAFIAKRLYERTLPGRNNPFDSDPVWNELAEVEEQGLDRLTALAARPVSTSDDAAVVWARRLAGPLFSSRKGRVPMSECLKDAAEVVLEAATQAALKDVVIADARLVPGWREELLAYRSRLAQDPGSRVGEFLAEMSSDSLTQSWFSEMVHGPAEVQNERSRAHLPGVSLT